MPRVFLVKRRIPLPASRSWDELPDEERADTYVPGEIKCVLLNYRSEDSCSLESCSSRDAETTNTSAPESVAEEKLLDLTLTHRTVRSKIKFTTGTCDDPLMHNCGLCGKGFRLQRMLNRHIKCHSEVKRHLCTFCGKGFNDTFDLKRHEFAHTNARSATKPLLSVVLWNHILKKSMGYSNNMLTSNGEINCMFVKTVATQAQPKRTCMCISVMFIREVLF
ncbi:transcription factor Ovo-like 2 isoform 3-T3 [Liasis olivaceus]